MDNQPMYLPAYQPASMPACYALFAQECLLPFPKEVKQVYAAKRLVSSIIFASKPEFIF